MLTLIGLPGLYAQISIGPCDDLYFHSSIEDYDNDCNLCEAIIPLILWTYIADWQTASDSNKVYYDIIVDL